MSRLDENLRLAALRVDVKTKDDLMRDYAEEAAVMHDLPLEETIERFDRFMAIYHFGSIQGSEADWHAIAGGDVEHSFIRLSKPFRFAEHEVIPLVMEAMRAHMRVGDRQLRVLDFGGGSGSDAIVYARMGHESHYADLLALKNTDAVARRFDIRGLDIPVHDAGALPEINFDVITAIDVIEHLYDVEDVAARLAARVSGEGLLCCANAFSSITYDGDHLDKNRVYLETFAAMMGAGGFKRVAHLPPLEVYRREQPALPTIREEEDRLRRAFYRYSHDHATGRCKELLAKLRGVTGDDATRGLPLHGTVVRGTGDTARAGASANRNGTRLKQRLLPIAARRAPGWVKRQRWNALEQAIIAGLASPAEPGQTLASLSDYAAVLRIAEHRLATLGEDV